MESQVKEKLHRTIEQLLVHMSVIVECLEQALENYVHKIDLSNQILNFLPLHGALLVENQFSQLFDHVGALDDLLFDVVMLTHFEK
jgi:hypothetical protein